MNDKSKRRNERKKKETNARMKRLRARGIVCKLIAGKVVIQQIPFDQQTTGAMKAMFDEISVRWREKFNQPVPEDLTLGEIHDRLSDGNGGDLAAQIIREMMELQFKAGVRHMLIFAYWKTDGLIITRENADIAGPEKVKAFEDACDLYDAIVEAGDDPWVGSPVQPPSGP